LDTGAENAGDLIIAKVSNSGGTVTHTGSILTRGGDDEVLLETSAFGTATGVLVNGGTQNDTLSQVIQGRFLASPTLQTRMLGGDGNDTLVIRTDTGIFGSGGIDLFPIVNCGAGVDNFNAFGQILGCEARL